MTINNEINLILNLLKCGGIFSFTSEKKGNFYTNKLQESLITSPHDICKYINIYKELIPKTNSRGKSITENQNKPLLANPPKSSSCLFSANETDKLIEKATTLEELKNILLNYKACGLAQTATNTVFGVGDGNSQLLVVGEAPGAEEDAQGEPFVGRSGLLLTHALESINIYRKNIFITNTVFWRPPGNRNPTSYEVALCKPFLDKIISLIKPKMILIVGKVAATTLLEEDIAIGKLRGKWLIKNWGFNNEIVNNINVRVVYHPAYLLRNPKQKKVFWFDLLEIFNKIEELGLKV